jgi:hypothetical protein
MANLLRSSQQRVLAIPELLELVLGFGDHTLQYACALVCQAWSNIALDLLWRDVDGLLNILRILCPLKVEMYLRDSKRWVSPVLENESLIIKFLGVLSSFILNMWKFVL